MKKGKLSYAFNALKIILDVKRAYDMVWRDGLCYSTWAIGNKVKMWKSSKVFVC